MTSSLIQDEENSFNSGSSTTQPGIESSCPLNCQNEIPLYSNAGRLKRKSTTNVKSYSELLLFDDQDLISEDEIFTKRKRRLRNPRKKNSTNSSKHKDVQKKSVSNTPKIPVETKDNSGVKIGDNGIGKDWGEKPTQMFAGHFILPNLSADIIDTNSQLIQHPGEEYFFQKGACQGRAFKKYRKCKSCIAKVHGDACRFKMLRLFRTSNSSIEYGPWFAAEEDTSIEEEEEDSPEKIYHPEGKEGSISLKDAAGYIRNLIAQPVYQMVHKDLLFINGSHEHKFPVAFRRDTLKGTRHLCDYCQRSIANVYWICRMCCMELCTDCFLDWTKPPTQLVKDPLRQQSQYFLNYSNCFLKYNIIHTVEDFLIVYKCPKGELEKVQNDAELLLCQNGISKDLPSDVPRQFYIFLKNEDAVITEAPQSTEPPKVEPIIPSPTPFNCDQASVQSLSFPIFHCDSIPSISDFQKYWQRETPILISHLDTHFTQNWTANYFMEKYSEEKIQAIDCKSLRVLSEIPLEKFFQGYDDSTLEFCHDCLNWIRQGSLDVNETGKCAKCKSLYRRIKIKDWPGTSDFREKLPNHFDDFMSILPFPEYTTRQGPFNLASSFPKTWLQPDLGPKMYSAYESGDGPGGIGTTCLHLDMADAINVIMYTNGSIEVCSPLPPEIKSFEEKEGKPIGAVWDIYPSADVPKIREFLDKIAIETAREQSVEDPVHDQNFYLDAPLRKRLFEQYQVRGYRIYQRMGDAVMIPAGCAHQVCNYRPCIKVALDFVSPESVLKCRQLTSEFRLLSKRHQRRCDLLQLDVIIYHAWRRFAHILSSS